MTDIIDRVNEKCVGYSHAKIKWPHILLHDCKDEIIQLRTLLYNAENSLEYSKYYTISNTGFNIALDHDIREIEQYKHIIKAPAINEIDELIDYVVELIDDTIEGIEK